jgi:hypothetical protein
MEAETQIKAAVKTKAKIKVDVEVLGEEGFGLLQTPTCAPHFMNQFIAMTTSYWLEGTICFSYRGLFRSTSSRRARNGSATLQAWAMHPFGLCGESPS